MKPVSRTKLKKWIDPKERFQTRLKFHHVFPKPRKKGKCRCGCSKEVIAPRRLWASKQCNDKAYEYYCVLKGDTRVIRRLLYKRDKAICQDCGKQCGRRNWDAHHLVAVAEGGGGCGLENLITICRRCHNRETKKLIRKLRKK